jgi:hypothetical protein
VADRGQYRQGCRNLHVKTLPTALGAVLRPLSDAPVLGTVFSMTGGEMTSLCGGDFLRANEARK